MNPYEMIDKYYSDNATLRHILVVHSEAVAAKALQILDAHPEWQLDREFVKEAALLHDIGIFLTDAAGIHCYRARLSGCGLDAEGGLSPACAGVRAPHGSRTFSERYRCTATAHSSPGDDSRFTRRTADLFCRQVFFQDASGCGKECGKGAEECG